MKLKDLEDILKRLRKKPLKTTLLIILIIIVICVVAYLKGLFGEKGKQAASFLKNPDIYVKDNIEKLRKYVEVEGEFIIIDEIMGEKVLKASEKKTDDPSAWIGYELRAQFYEDVSEYINLTLHSERFGYTIRLKVPAAMQVWALLDLIIEGLCLPREIHVEELGISVEFTYSLISNVLLDRHETLLESGLKNGSSLRLKIDVIVRDSRTRKLENEWRSFAIAFARDPGEEWHNAVKELGQKVEKMKKKLYERHAEAIFKEPWFAHLEIK